ncbi:MAG: ACT domain-containing protein [Pseudomonas sp.]|uniref:glycine cleavage system protein R n=1 Tax=Pseudomonas sp. TaxID=306 RepID=UPI003981981D
MDHLVLTVIAQDQPGLVERVAQCISAHGGNWLESRMSRMAGQFAGILRVDVPLTGHAGLLVALDALQAQGIRVQVAAGGDAPLSVWQAIRLELVGNDRPGIVRDITRLLSAHGVNLESLNTEVVPAPMSGELLFQAQALLGVPQSLSLEQLQTHLETLADDLMVELKLQADD